MKKPMYEIISDDCHIKIMENGIVEGWPEGKKCLIINRVPLLVMRELESYQISNKGVDSQC